MDEKGILQMPQPAMSKKLKQNVLDAVMNIFNDAEFTCQLPGKRDSVSIGKNNMSKRLILCNLRELYASFNTRHPEMKIGFSKFASLCPKWCIYICWSLRYPLSMCVHTIPRC